MPITQAITRYQTSKCESSFAEIYYYFYSQGNNMIGTLARHYKLDEHDVESTINGKLMEIADIYQGSADKFKNAVYQAVRRGCIDLVRKRNTQEKYTTEVMYEDDDGKLNEVYEIIEVAPTTEDNDILGIQKKRDQRQLVTFLLSNANELTLTSALTFIETDSYRKAAKQIGTTDKTVKSRIRNLSKRYDETLFGSYYDYFTTPTMHVG